MNEQITVTSADGKEMTTLIYARTDAQFQLAKSRETSWAKTKTAAQLKELDYKPLEAMSEPRRPELRLIQGGLDKYDPNTITVEDFLADQPPPRKGAA